VNEIKEPSKPNCGDRVRTSRGVAVCTDHRMGHYDPVMDLSWPAGRGPFVMAPTSRPVSAQDGVAGVDGRGGQEKDDTGRLSES
jgi:hypothetical protein